MKRYHVIGASIGLAVIVLVIVVINRSYKPYKTGPNVRAEFLENLENVGALTFRSFDGKWIGTSLGSYIAPVSRRCAARTSWIAMV